jgi:hypothetical protein
MTPLSPEREQQAVDAITALDWKASNTAAREAVTMALAVTDEQAELIVGQLSDRRIVRMVASVNNLAETGSTLPARVKWDRAGIPTTLELVSQLTALDGFVTLDRSREAVSRFCDCSIDEANDLLYALRDKNIVNLEGEGSNWRWRRCP